MAVTIAGAHVAVSSLVSGCYSIVKGINQLRQSYRFMPLTLSSIVLTCNTTSSTLNQVNLTLENYSGTKPDFHQDLLDQFNGIMIGCTMTLSLLETHVSDLLDLAGSDMPLKAQKTSRTDKLKALYNESDMKELLRQLNVYITLLNTIQNHLQSDKQDKMIDMMTSQEKTLESMLRAQVTLRGHLQTVDTSLDKDCDSASIRTSTTSTTTLTAFDFDAAIKGTAVYQRCMRRRSDRTDLLSLRLSTAQPDASSESENTMIEKQRSLASELATGGRTLQNGHTEQLEDKPFNPYAEEDWDSDSSHNTDIFIPKTRYLYMVPPRRPFRPSNTIDVACHAEIFNTPSIKSSPRTYRLEEGDQAMDASQYHLPAFPTDSSATDATERDTIESLATRDFQLFQSRMLSFSRPARVGTPKPRAQTSFYGSQNRHSTNEQMKFF